ncbi:DUF927 domain-containing protein [Geobacter pelophilus]|uniref:DUF927 domain-containing protein n=1 Tax=Geoanaerobacter pelophilus TaxID=60036 RepID=A0AAW4LAY8_9BACT|nr:DUF927 domain-containing protein [Geoanaerobacter pelophilus]MBT0664346.1 DUF927 domain-containing protein [Geoanaerobacter pelophilus]
MATDTDHNDLAKKRGLKAVKKSVDSAVDAAKGVMFGAFLIMAGGVFWRKPKGEEAEDIFFSSFLKPLAVCRDSKALNASILFEMKNLDGHPVQFLLRIEDTQAGGGELARIAFVQRGGYFGAGIRARQLFADFINSILKHSRNLPRITLADRTGWLKSGGKWCFVLPDSTIGPSPEKVMLQQGISSEAPGYEQSGTLADWNREVGRLCIGNSRLILAACCALAGPLLAILNREGGGLHIVGTSSEGKTTALILAASVIGGREAVKTLDATKTALEAAAALSNDSTLFLDELGSGAPDAIASMVYALVSGVGRGRGDQRGDLRERRSWRVMFITTGEIDLETMMRGIGKRAASGQQLRLANIPASHENSHGIFEDLHGFTDGAALSDHIRQAAAQHHGSVFRAFLKKLTDDLNRDEETLRKLLNSMVKKFVAHVAPAGSDGQVVRVASRFALLAAAGEYAAHCGVLSWPEGEAQRGVRACFEAWLQRRGGHGPLEVKTLLEQFEGWLQANGEARFTPMDGDVKGSARPIINRAGFRREVADVTGSSATEYFIFTTAFREAVQGHDPRWAARILAEHGLLAKVHNGELYRQKKLPGIGNQRVYHVPARIGDGADPAESFQ